MSKDTLFKVYKRIGYDELSYLYQGGSIEVSKPQQTKISTCIQILSMLKFNVY